MVADYSKKLKWFQEKFNNKLNSGNVCNDSAQSRLSLLIPAESLRIEITKLYNFIFSFWCKTWSLILREKHKSRHQDVQNIGAETVWHNREDVTEGQMKVTNKELRDLNLSSVNIRVTKLLRMRPKKHVTCLK